MRAFEEAARASRFEKAVSAPRLIKHNGKQIRAEIVKPLQGDGYWHWEGTGIRIRQAKSSEIDHMTSWKPY